MHHHEKQVNKINILNCITYNLAVSLKIYILYKVQYKFNNILWNYSIRSKLSLMYFVASYHSQCMTGGRSWVCKLVTNNLNYPNVTSGISTSRTLALLLPLVSMTNFLSPSHPCFLCCGRSYDSLLVFF